MTWDQTNLQYFQRAGKVTVTQAEELFSYSGKSSRLLFVADA